MKKLFLLSIALIFFTQITNAQCNCPNVGPELVTNGDFSQGNTGFTTVYSYANFAIEIKPVSSLYVPNAFTPNEDGKNEFFLAQGTNITEFESTIFDRWGNLIFESKDINKGWSGIVQKGGMDMNGNSEENAQQDVYVWKIKAKGIEGKNYDRVGHVSLIK